MNNLLRRDHVNTIPPTISAPYYIYYAQDLNLSGAFMDHPATIQYTGTQGKVLELLGNGLSPEVVATHLGISPSYVSQLLSEEHFATQVTSLRFQNLQAATNRDRKYDDIEDQLLAKMQDLLPLMYKPLEVMRAITIINGAKRRGAAATPEHTHINNTIVNLTIPTQVLQKFSVNSNNQVVEISSETVQPQTLVTMPSSQLLSKIQSKPDSKGGNSHDSYPIQSSVGAIQASPA